MEFDIPTDLANLWRYMHHMYHLDAFTQVRGFKKFESSSTFRNFFFFNFIY